MNKTQCAMNCGICFEAMLELIEQEKLRQPLNPGYLPFDNPGLDPLLP